MFESLLDIILSLPLDSMGEALIATCLSLLVWFVAKMRKKVAQELSPNGGSSTKDVVLRLEKKMGDIEKELKFTNTSFRFVHNSVNYCAFRTDAAGRNTDVTDKYMEFVGRPEHDLLGLDWLSLVPIEFDGVLWRDRVLTEFNACLEMHRIYKMVHPIYVKRDGRLEVVYIDSVAYPVVVDDKLIGTVGGFVEYTGDN